MYPYILINETQAIQIILAIQSLAGTGVGIGIDFGALMHSVSRDPYLNNQLITYAILGLALHAPSGNVGQIGSVYDLYFYVSFLNDMLQLATQKTQVTLLPLVSKEIEFDLPKLELEKFIDPQNMRLKLEIVQLSTGPGLGVTWQLSESFHIGYYFIV